MTGGGATQAVLPPVLRGWPAVLQAGVAPAGLAATPATDALLTRIRSETLWWPAPRRGAPAPRALALDAAGLAAARARWDDAEVARADDPAAVAPDRLEAVFGPPGAPAALWAALGGCGGSAPPDPAGRLAAARAVCPWTGAALTLEAGLDAQALLRRAALRPGGRAGLVAMSPWKRRCLRPFLIGPDGPPAAVRSVAQARARGLTPVVWGAATEAPSAADAGDPAAPLLVEDGFLRSVGLGTRHAPPASLAISRRRPHFDATGPNAFDAVVAAARFEPALLARAEALAARIVALGLTKYNLSGAGAPPDAEGRLKLLAAGQVAADASIRLGARAIRSDLDLLRAARARFPDAFILYKPHPDVRTGLRAGAAPAAAVARLADAEAGDLDATACLAWCDRVITITSLIGFEALLRGKPATVCGRPFYAGWGLTDDLDPPARDHRLSRAALIAAALILLPSYVDPRSGLPAPPEVVVEALARERAAAGRPAARLRGLWRHGVSTLLNRL